MRGHWEDDGHYLDDDTIPDTDNTVWRLVVRVVAAVLLFSMLGGLLIAWRGVEGMMAFGLVVLVGLIAAIVSKQQREAEDTYGSEDPPDPMIH